MRDNIHLHGYVNDVRINETKTGKTAVNLDVVTIEKFKQGEEYKSRKTYHDVVIFTEDPKFVEGFKAVKADIDANKANKDVEGYKMTNHQVAVDGFLVNKKDSNDLQVLSSDSRVKLDVAQEDKEVANKATISGNIAQIKVYEDKNFAALTIINHFRPEGSDNESETRIMLRVDGDRRYSKSTFEAIKEGKMGIGDFIRVSGQLHNNNFEGKDQKMNYGMALDVNSSEILAKKGEKKEAKAEVKAEPEKKAAKKAEKKAAPAKKAVSRKKKGVTMG